MSLILPILDADREERSPQVQIVVFHEVSVIVGSLVLEANVGAQVEPGTGALNGKLDDQRLSKKYVFNM